MRNTSSSSGAAGMRGSRDEPPTLRAEASAVRAPGLHTLRAARSAPAAVSGRRNLSAAQCPRIRATISSATGFGTAA